MSDPAPPCLLPTPASPAVDPRAAPAFDQPSGSASVTHQPGRAVFSPHPVALPISSASGPKLSNLRRDRPPASIKRNHWLVIDRIETLKSAALILVIGAVLAAGIWLIVAGLSR